MRDVSFNVVCQSLYSPFSSRRPRDARVFLDTCDGGWWWLDSVAALALIPFIIKEAHAAISGGPCSGCDERSLGPSIPNEKGGG